VCVWKSLEEAVEARSTVQMFSLYAGQLFVVLYICWLSNGWSSNRFK